MRRSMTSTVFCASTLWATYWLGNPSTSSRRLICLLSGKMSYWTFSVIGERRESVGRDVMVLILLEVSFGDMVTLHKGFHHRFPVAGHHLGDMGGLVAVGQFLAVEVLRQNLQVLRQRRTVVIQVDKDEATPGFEPDFRQAKLIPVYMLKNPKHLAGSSDDLPATMSSRGRGSGILLRAPVRCTAHCLCAGRR